jgi:predicted phosphatase
MNKKILAVIKDFEQNKVDQASIFIKQKYIGFMGTENNKKYIVLLVEHNYGFKRLKRLARFCNEQNIHVLFQRPYTYKTKKQELRLLKKIANISQDDVKTAVVNGSLKDTNKVIGNIYTYNQRLGDNYIFLHAEEIIVNYLNPKLYENYWLTLLEPCYKCLRSMSDVPKTELIEYVKPHKAKWNTKDYERLSALLSHKYRRLK